MENKIFIDFFDFFDFSILSIFIGNLIQSRRSVFANKFDKFCKYQLLFS